jgi:PAS domain S-box-containing protein
MQGKFLNLNKKFEEESGYRREEMIGRNVLMSGIVTAPSAAKIAYNLNLISDRKESPIFEIDGISKGGRIVPYEVRSTPVEKAGRVVAVQATLRNISDRRQAETAVRESQKWLEEIVKGSPIPQFVIDRKHRVISWNRALEEYSEVKSEEVLGTTLAWKAFYEVERPVMADLLVDNSIDKIPVWYAGKYNRSKYVEGAYEATDFFPRMGKAGIWLFFTASAIRDSNGAVIGAVETLEDVTDIKEKEIVLHASEERYRTIVENIQDVVYRSDLHGNLVMASPSCAALLGYESIDDCLGKNIAAEFYMYPEKRQEILDAVNRHGAVKDYEVVLKRKDGTPLTVSTSSHVYFDKSGVPLGIEGVFRDITERKRAEDALRESEQRYRCLLGALFDAVVIHQDGRIVAANNAALAMIGAQKPDDVIGRPVMQFVHPVSQSSVRERIRQMSEKPAVTVPLIEEKFVRPDGTVFDTEVVATGFILDGKPAVQVVFRDITDRKEAEEELRNSEEKYRTIFENTGTATVLVEENTIISLANAEFERLSGYTKDEIE